MDLVDKVATLAFIGITETCLVHLAFTKLMHRNGRSWAIYACALGVYLLCAVVDAALGLSVYFVMVFCYILIAIIAFLFFDNSREERLIIPFVFVAVDYAATVCSDATMWRAGLASTVEMPGFVQQTILSQALITVLVILVIAVLRSLQRIEDAHRGVTPLPLAILTSLCTPLVTMLLLMHELFALPAGSAAQLGPEAQVRQDLVVAALLLLVAITLFTLSARIAKLIGSLERSATLEQLISAQQRNHLAVLRHQRELARIHHDIKNHNQTIAALLAGGRIAQARAYVDALSERVDGAELVVDCDHQVLAALLNEKLSPAKRRGVDVNVSVMVPEPLAIPDVDLCVVLGNLLDNAIEACDRIEGAVQRFIDVDIRLSGPILCVCVANSYEGTATQAGSRIDSPKGDGSAHGIGLSSVRMVAARYGGRLSIARRAHVFSASVLLALQSECGV